MMTGMTKVGKAGLIVLIAAAFAGSQAFATEIAKVNGQSLTDRDLRMALSSMNEGMRENVLKDANSRRQILNGLIEQEILVGEAVKEKLDQDQEYKDALASFRKQFLSSRALQKNLGTKVTEVAAKKFYEANKTRYSTDRVHVQHILVKDEDKAREILKLTKGKNVDFQDLAVKYSRDPSVKNNRGDIGAFGRQNPYEPSFSDAAFSGVAGEIVGPVKTAFGYHLIKIVDRTVGKPMNYDEVSMQVKRDMSQGLRDSYISKLRQQAKIHINDKALDKI